MKKTYLTPKSRLIIVQDCYLQSMSVKDEYADEELGMDAKGEREWSNEGSTSNDNLWDKW